MCQFGMASPITGSHGDVGHAKKPTGFLSSSRFVAEELNRYCDSSHDHVHLMAGKAAAAQVFPPDLCKVMLRGIARQKKLDASLRVATTSMTAQKTRYFIRSLSSVCLGTVRHVVEEACEGRYPRHWKDAVHGEDGGCDDRGFRPQHGIELLKGELDALTFKNGIAVAVDDVSGQEWVPCWCSRLETRKSHTS